MSLTVDQLILQLQEMSLKGLGSKTVHVPPREKWWEIGKVATDQNPDAKESVYLSIHTKDW